MWAGLRPRSSASGPIAIPTLVAITASCLRPARAFPSNSSERPPRGSYIAGVALVHVGGVEEIGAAVESRRDDGRGLRFPDRGAEEHGADADYGNLDIGIGNQPRLHFLCLSSWGQCVPRGGFPARAALNRAPERPGRKAGNRQGSETCSSRTPEAAIERSLRAFPAPPRRGDIVRTMPWKRHTTSSSGRPARTPASRPCASSRTAPLVAAVTERGWPSRYSRTVPWSPAYYITGPDRVTHAAATRWRLDGDL